jgi:hypothetical protein
MQSPSACGGGGGGGADRTSRQKEKLTHKAYKRPSKGITTHLQVNPLARKQYVVLYVCLCHGEKFDVLRFISFINERLLDVLKFSTTTLFACQLIKIYISLPAKTSPSLLLPGSSFHRIKKKQIKISATRSSSVHSVGRERFRKIPV